MGETETERVHVLVLPFPVQGHINPMLQFAKRLASHGLKVSLLTAFINPDAILPNTAIAVHDISDGSEVDRDPRNVASFLERVRQLVSLKLPQFVLKQKETVTYLVYDSVIPWALDIARELGLSAAPFFTQPCAVNAIFYSVHKGLLEIPLDHRHLPVSTVPGLPLLDLFDLPSFLYDPVSYPPMLRLLIDQFSNFTEADCIFFNTFDGLEQEVVTWATSQWAVKNVGPCIPSMYLDKRLKEDKDYGLSLFKEEAQTCTTWLDTKGDSSVVYVAFGSLAALAEEQMEEVASALRDSTRYFLWVVRATELEKLPRNFEEETAGRGLVVSWCHQLEVLSHAAVGCFVSHCGWNSTLEALSQGVPMVCLPQWSDQPTIAKLIADVWRVGARAKADPNGIITAQELGLCIGEVMEGERAAEIKLNSEKWKRLARAAADEGGTSDSNIQEFVAKLGRA